MLVFFSVAFFGWQLDYAMRMRLFSPPPRVGSAASSHWFVAVFSVAAKFMAAQVIEASVGGRPKQG